MRYASTYDKSGAPVVAELQGDLLVPLAGLTDLARPPPPRPSRRPGGARRTRSRPAEAELRAVVPNPARSSASA